jgi:hypothetical protein
VFAGFFDFVAALRQYVALLAAGVQLALFALQLGFYLA